MTGRRTTRRQSTGARTFAALLAAVAIAMTAITTTVVPAGAAPTRQDAAPVALDVLSVTPWVEPDGTWTARMRVSNAPADAVLTYSIRQPVSGTEAAVRATMAAERADGDTAKVLQRPVSTPLPSMTDTSGVTELAVAIRSTRADNGDRVLIPNSGVYPVVVTIMTAEKEPLDQTTLYLNRMPTTPRSSAFRLGVLVHHSQDSGFDDQGAPAVDAALRAAIGATTEVLSAGAGLALGVDLSPQSLTALDRSEVDGDGELLDRLRRNLGDAGVVRVPWAQMHAEGWAIGGTLRDMQTALVDGQEALFANLAVPTEPSVWPVDPTVGPAAVDQFANLGVTGLAVDAAQLVEAKPPTGESGVSRPFRVVGATGGVTGFSLDPDLQALLATPSATEGAATGGAPTPQMIVHQMVALMFAVWLADDHERGALIRIADDADDGVTTELLELLAANAPEPGRPAGVEVVPAAALIALPPLTSRQSGRTVEWIRELVPPAQTPRVDALSRGLVEVRPLMDDYRDMLPPDDVDAERHEVVVRRSLDQRIAPGVQATLLADVATAMRNDLALLDATERGSLMLTDRHAFIPLRFTNGLGRPVKARLRLQSPRLDFAAGSEQTLTLQPGINRVDVEVDVRASGQFLMQADLLAPRSERVLTSTRQRVQSRTFSGVGLMLSGGALLFLVVWWSRTLRRSRRSGEDASGAGPDGSPGRTA